MNNLTVFSNEQFGQVRTIDEGGKVLFCGKDIAGALGYADTVNALKQHCRWVVKRHLPHPQSPDKQIELAFIPEGDVYRLITHSKLPAAERFEKWVFEEVLPSIRRTGAYSVPALTPSELLLQQAQIMVEHEKRFERLEAQSARQEQKMEKVVEIFSVPSLDRDLWQQEMNRYISGLCESYGLSHQLTRGDLYRELESEAGVNLESRRTRMQNRMKRAGAKYAERQAVTKLAVIAADKKLRPIFEGICRQYAARLAAAVC